MHKQLLESNGIGSPRLDKERGIVRNVKVLGLRSSHGYDYSPAAVRGAAKLYEGKSVNIDHPSDRSKLGASRSYRDRFAKLRSIHYVEGKGLFGDLHYNRGHQLARQFEWDVEHSPDNLGLSHNASGRASGDGQLIESIDSVRSVDLVADPATNVGLFEARRGDESAPKVPRSLRQVAADSAFDIVANEDLDIPTKRTMLMGLLDLFADAMESGSEGDASDESAGSLVGPRAVAESRLYDLLADGSREERRQLVEQRLDKKPRFDLRSLLN